MSSPDEPMDVETAEASPTKKPRKAAKKAKKPRNLDLAKKAIKKPVKKPGKKAVKAPAAKKPGKKAPAKKAAKANGKNGNKRGQGTKFIGGALYTMIRKSIPPKMLNEDGKTINVKKLAPAVKTSLEGVYKWFRTDKVAPDKAVRLMKVAGGKLKHHHFIPFVFPK